MGIELIVEFTAGASIRSLIYVYDDDDNLVDPTSVLITWVDKDGTTQVDQVNIVSDGRLETGVFEHYYNTDSDSVKGWWEGLAEIIDGSGETARTSIAHAQVNVI